MIITCPRCSTKYSVDAAVIRPAGRSVRCSNCSYIWLQSGPPARTPPDRAAAAAGPLATDAGAGSGHDAADATGPFDRPVPSAGDAALDAGRDTAEHGDVADDDRPMPWRDTAGDRFDRDQERQRAEDLIGAAEPIDDGDAQGIDEPDDAAPEPIPSVLSSPPAGRGVATGYGSRTPGRLLLIAGSVLAALVVVAGLLVLARGPIAAALPFTAGLYEALGLEVDTLGAGLHIVDVASRREASETGETLVVTGVVANVEDEERSVPSIRVMLLDTDDDPLQTEIVTPARRILSPGDRLDFAARLANPSPQARRIMVTFAPREDDG